VAALEAQVAGLETQLADLNAQLAAVQVPAGDDPAGSAPAAFNVAVAQYVMDTAGFHSMDEALQADPTVDPAFLSAVRRVRKVVAATAWPEDLREQSAAFVTLLDEFALALDADDGAAAARLAAEAHTVQHDFSHAIDNWLGGDDHGHAQ
jgi:hypothetical protein